ncbi:MAG: tetratricopeptide repeat protein [Rubrivivax sp.]|nr:tetratricopeptide repeat protein [Rubrivivax sp.]
MSHVEARILRGGAGACLPGLALQALPRQLLLAGLLVAVVGLAGCASRGKAVAEEPPTLKALASRPAPVPADAGIRTSEAQAKAAYEAFLAANPRAPQRAQALRRLGDLEMDVAQRKLEEDSAATPDFRAAIQRYETVLKAHPQDPANDRVLYQLARAHEQGGQLDAALKTLDRLVAQYPQTAHRDEAQFRRGELLFTNRAYAQAEAAFAQVLAREARTPFHERALYMQGWSQFKQARLDEGLRSFLGVLDLKLEGQGDEPLDQLPGMTRADRELVDDTFRVASLSLMQLQGAGSIPPLIDTPARQGYEFRLYQHLGELYLGQERVKDAAETLGAFARRHPRHAQAPRLQARVIDIYAGSGFAQLALEAKRDYVERYGPASDFRRANPEGWAQAQPLLRQHLIELASHHHALYQKRRDEPDALEAERWYRQWLAAFGGDAQAPHNSFLLGELLFEARRWAAAEQAYEQAAYGFAPHARSADAGYGALLALEQQARALGPEAAPRRALRQRQAQAAQRFAQAFAQDARTGPVLAEAADQLFALGDGAAAAALADQVLALRPPAPDAALRTALTVLAHRAFEQKAYAEAEQAYARLLALPRPGAPTPGAITPQELQERLAAAIYQQGDAARAAGRLQEAAGHFARVEAAAPASRVRANAQFDQAATQIALKDWESASRTLEAFRQQHAGHALAPQVAPRLAAVYLELNRPAAAAAEFERWASAEGTAEDVARAARWQAAQLQAQAGPPAQAARAWEHYLRRHPQPLEPAVEARWRLVQLAQAEGQAARALQWARELRQAEEQGAEQRTPRSRAFAARAQLALAAPLLQAYREVRLVEPLARQLKLKKARMEAVLQVYATASESGAAEVVTEATFKTAALYQDFGQALLAAPRPKGLKKAEAEQYAVMLEEQAFPFEERAAELHELNARRTAQGLWDDAIRDSLQALAQLRPARWGRAERSEPSLPGAELAVLEKAVAAGPAAAELWNQLGVAYRRAGRFDDARRAYEKAMTARAGYATPVLNLAILDDLYLRRSAQALAGYERYQALLGAPDAQVSRWQAELKTRKPDAPALAAAGGKP